MLLSCCIKVILLAFLTFVQVVRDMIARIEREERATIAREREAAVLKRKENQVWARALRLLQCERHGVRLLECYLDLSSHQRPSEILALTRAPSNLRCD